jgi:hypothetical protein
LEPHCDMMSGELWCASVSMHTCAGVHTRDWKGWTKGFKKGL